MRLKAIFFSFIILNSIVAFGFLEVGKVETVVTSRKIAVIRTSESLNGNVESLFIGTNDKNCEANIFKNDGLLVSVDISQCVDVNIVAGTAAYHMPGLTKAEEPQVKQLAPPPQPPETTLKEANSTDKIHRFGLGFRINNRLTYTDAEFSSGAAQEKHDIQITTSGVPLVLEYSFSTTSMNSWGWELGIGYTSFKWDKISTAGTTANIVGSTNILTPFFNAIYRWDSLYLPFGINVSSLAHYDQSVFMNENSGTLGLQLGLGYILNQNVTILAKSVAYGFSSSIIQAGSVAIQPGNGFATGMNLMVLFNF